MHRRAATIGTVWLAVCEWRRRCHESNPCPELETTALRSRPKTWTGNRLYEMFACLFILVLIIDPPSLYPSVAFVIGGTYLTHTSP